MLGIKESLERMAKASSMLWYGLVLRKEEENVMLMALKFDVSGSRGRGRPKQTWKKQVEYEMMKNGLVKENACDRTKWQGVVKTMITRNPANFVNRGQYRIQNVMMMITKVTNISQRNEANSFNARWARRFGNGTLSANFFCSSAHFSKREWPLRAR